MARGIRSSSFRCMRGVGMVVAAGALVACSTLLGIDDGIPDGLDAATMIGVGVDAADTDATDIDAGAIVPADAAAGEPVETPSDDAGAATPEAGCVSDPAWCNGRCEGTTDNCGRPVDCGSCEAGVSVTCPSCPSGQVCFHSACCAPSGCGGSCLDNCGQSSQACCPTSVPDSGGSAPPDSGGGGGSCTAMGGACTSNAACCTGACDSAGLCVTSCGVQSASCNTNLPCCYGLTCRPVLTPESTSVDPTIVPEPSRCE